MLEAKLSVLGFSWCMCDNLRASSLAAIANVELLARADIVDAPSSLVTHGLN